MPLLTASDALPRRPRRVIVGGASGAGKTTLARRIAGVIDAPHHEIDALFHGPGWTQRETFETDAHDIARTDHWVIEWQYSQVRALLADRADLLVWLDLPRLQVLRQVTARTVHRRWSRSELWNGNVEGPLWTILTDPDHVVRWSWRTHPTWESRTIRLLRRRPDLPVVRLRRHAEASTWLERALRPARPL